MRSGVPQGSVLGPLLFLILCGNKDNYIYVLLMIIIVIYKPIIKKDLFTATLHQSVGALISFYKILLL